MTCTLCGSSAHSPPHCKWRNTCLSCEHVEAKGLPKGFGTCKPSRQSLGHSRSITKPMECAKRSNAADDVVKKRISWIEGRA